MPRALPTSQARTRAPVVCRASGTAGQALTAERAAAAPAAALQHQPPTTTPHDVASAAASVPRLYEALNRRDMAGVSSLLAGDCSYENYAVDGWVHGQQAAAQCMFDSLAAVPPDARFQLDGIGGGAAGGQGVGVAWRLVMEGSGTLVSRGVSFYTLQADGRIARAIDSPEYFAKLSRPGLNLMAPLVKSLTGPVLPAMRAGLDALFGAPPQLPPQARTPLAAPQAPPPPKQQQQHVQPAAAVPNYQPSVAAASWGQAAPGKGSGSGAGGKASGQPTVAAPATAAAAASSQEPARPQPQPVAAAPAAPAQGAAASAAGGGPGPSTPANLSGLWLRDDSRSDAAAYERALDLLQLSGMQKVTARLIEAIELRQGAASFDIEFITIIPFFKVKESVPINGTSQLGRRDLRSGKQAASARLIEGGIAVQMTWGAPLAGQLVEEYVLVEADTLELRSVTTVGRDSAPVVNVYRRSQVGRDALLSASKQRNGSFGDVLARGNK